VDTGLAQLRSRERVGEHPTAQVGPFHPRALRRREDEIVGRVGGLGLVLEQDRRESVRHPDGAQRAQSEAKHSADEAVRRAQAKACRLVRTHVLGYMVTLTFPGEGVHVCGRAPTADFLHDHGPWRIGAASGLQFRSCIPAGMGGTGMSSCTRGSPSRSFASLREGWTYFLGRRGMEPSGLGWVVGVPRPRM
jgi:hypothetical protein